MPNDSVEPTIILRPGTTLSSWPQLKFQHGQASVRQLESRVNEWLASNPFRAISSLSDDRHILRAELSVRNAAPIDEWSLLLGDALHAFRSALDGLAWNLATYGDANPARKEQVYFPIAVTSRQWSAAKSNWLDAIPAELSDRVLSVQPFRYPTTAPSVLEVLHKLDIQDKHRSAIEARVHVGGVEHDLEAQYLNPDPTAPHSPPVLLAAATDASIPFEDGALLFELDFGEPMARAEVSPQPVITLTVELDGVTLEAGPTLGMIAGQVNATIRLVARGTLDSNTAWLPVNIVTGAKSREASE